ncbi:MAG TPA: hypothetical protein VIT88_04595, partial [Pyrinomonadaceae bacterium]
APKNQVHAEPATLALADRFDYVSEFMGDSPFFHWLSVQGRRDEDQPKVQGCNECCRQKDKMAGSRTVND